MNKKSLYFLSFAAWIVSSALPTKSYAQFPVSYPVTKAKPYDTIIFNTKLNDNYAWLSQPANEKEMLNWAKTQSTFTNNILDSIPGTEKVSKLLDEIYTPNSDAFIVKGTQGSHSYYYKRLPDGKSWFMRKAKGQETEEKVISLPFEFNGRKYTAKKFAFAYQKKLVALMLVEEGESNPHLRFFDLDKKAFLSDSIGRVMFNDASGVSMAWLPNDAGLIYSRAPQDNSAEEKYYRGQLKLHFIGNKQESDQSIFGFNVNKEIDLKDYETPYIYSFAHSPYIIARIRAGKGNNYAFAIHYLKLKDSLINWVKLNNYKANHGTFTANGKYLYAIDDAVPNMQVIKIDLVTGSTPRVFIKENEKILAMSTGDPSIIGGKNTLYIKYSAPGKGGIMKSNYSNGSTTDIKMPLDGFVGEFNLIGKDDLLFVTTNWVHDFEYYTINHSSNSISHFSKSESKTLNTTNYTSQIIYVPSRDGIQIPVSLVYPVNIKLKEKTQPLLIEAYGCFGSSMEPLYNPEKFIWLEMGGIYAAAHIRGGGELGAKWASAGSYPTKMNSINDIVDIAEFFVKNKFTSREQQAITGASCGTLNVGLATVQRPDLFSAGVFIVGIPDLVTNKGNSFGRGQNEFGPLDTENGFQSRLAISAYHHIIPNRSAPAMLVINGANDYIVPLHNAARYVAKLQNVQQSDRPALFMVDWKNGHAAAGTSLEDVIRMWKFLFWQTGHVGFQPR